MAAKLKVTDRTKFDQTIQSVDFKDLHYQGANIFSGSVLMYTTDDNIIPYHGLIYANDFERDYGFVIINPSEATKP